MREVCTVQGLCAGTDTGAAHAFVSQAHGAV